MLFRIGEMLQQRRNRKQLYSTEAYWDSKASSYDETAVSMWPNKVLNQLYENELIELILRHLKNLNTVNLLDLGCGTGRFSRWFAGKGTRVIGIDFSEASLRIARKLSSGSNIEYQHGSVFEIEGEDVYDVVFTWGVLTIACQDKKQLKEALLKVRDAIKPNGFLFLNEPIHQGFLHRVLDLKLVGFLDVMKEVGFEVKAVSPLHFWPVRLVLAYVSWPSWVTIPAYHFGQILMRLPGLSLLGDYWAILATPIKNSVK